MEAHEPLQPPAEALRAVTALRGRDESTVQRVEQLASSAPPLWTMDAQTIALAEDLYDAEIASLDHELRRFFRALDRRDLPKDAMIIVTADHGEEFLDHGAIGHGHTLYEELIRVPCRGIKSSGAACVRSSDRAGRGPFEHQPARRESPWPGRRHRRPDGPSISPGSRP